MNSKQLFYALFTNHVTQPYFDGVYPADQLEEIIMKPQLVIANASPSSSGGKHWLLFFFEGNTVDFFDSTGRDLNTYGDEFVDFVRRYAETYNHFDAPVQPSNTDICGELCLYFAYMKCLGFDFETIIKSMNDTQVLLKFVGERFRICEKCPDLQKSVLF